MNRIVCALWVGLVATTFAVTACGPSQTSNGEKGNGEDDGDDDTGPGPGPDPTPVTTCAASCTTDLDAAKDALKSGNYQQAFDAYRCADNPEAAFGAGLTRVLLAFDGDNADKLLADFGQPPLPATDVFGARGILMREAARWNGEGSLTLSGGLSVAIPLDRAQQQISTDVGGGLGYFQAESVADPSHADLELSFNSGEPITNGTVLAVTTTCTGTFPTTTIDPRIEWLDLWFDVGTSSYSCSIPYDQPIATCQPDGGSIVVTSAASAVGDSASYEFRNLMLTCYDGSSDLATDDIIVRVSGTASATAVSDELDTSGLHPIFAEGFELAGQIPAGKTLTDVMQHAGSAGAELEEAACFFDIAGQGTGHVFDIPGVLFGGSDVPISKGDAEIIASLSLSGAALGHVAWMHEISMPLNRLICEDEASCPTDQQYVTEFNAAFASNFHGGRLEVVKRLVTQALPLLDRGLADLDGSSLFVRDAKSTAGLDALRTLVQASNDSLANGEMPLPRVTPALLIDWKELFGTARNPKSAGPLLRYEETVEDGETYTSVELNTTFLQRYFAGRIDADWENGDYDWTDEEVASDAFEELGTNMQRYLVYGN
jgi:hypothetical protein